MEFGPDKKYFMIRFIAVYAVTILLLAALFASFWTPAPQVIYKNKKEGAEGSISSFQKHLMQADEWLHLQFNKIREMEEQYAMQENDSSATNRDELKLQITEAQNAMRNSLDSLELASAKYNSGKEAESFKNMTSYFKYTLNNKSLMNASTSLPVGEGSQDKSSKLVLALKNELEEKNKKIAELENRGATSGQDALAHQSTVVNLQKEVRDKNSRIAALEQQLKKAQAVTPTYARANGEDVEALKQRNANLKLAYNSAQTQLGLLTKQYRALKRDNEILISQLRDSRRLTSGNY